MTDKKSSLPLALVGFAVGGLLAYTAAAEASARWPGAFKEIIGGIPGLGAFGWYKSMKLKPSGTKSLIRGASTAAIVSGPLFLALATAGAE